MKSEDLAEVIREEILEGNYLLYCRMLDCPGADVRNKYWQKASALYAQLDPDQQEVFRSVIRQVIVDTISSVLGVIDGSVILKKYREEFILLYGEGQEKVNNCLLDYFLSSVEDQNE